jgi:hypothetical protein
VSASAGDNAPAPQADSPAAAAPGTDSPADPAVPGAAAGRARPDATALTSPAPAPDATALVAPAAAPASPADMGVPATPSVTAVAPRTVTATPATGPRRPHPRWPRHRSRQARPNRPCPPWCRSAAGRAPGR